MKAVRLIILFCILLAACSPKTVSSPGTLPASPSLMAPTDITIPPTETATTPPTPSQPMPTETPDPGVNYPDTDTPVAINEVGGGSRAIAYQDPYVYLGVGLRMVILDVSQPEVPQVMGQTDILQDKIQGITMKDNLAFVVGGEIRGLLVFDISEPTTPMQVGYLHIPYYCKNVVVVNDYAYVQTVVGVHIVDIYDPANPIEVSSYANPYIMFTDLAVSGDYVYLAAENGDVYYFNIVKNALVEPPQAFEAPSHVEDLVANGNELYVLNWNSLVIADITNPAVGITQLGKLELDYNALNSIVQRSNTLYLGGEFLLAVDVSNPRTPRTIGRIEESGEDMAVSEQHAFLARFLGGMTSIYLADPTAPVKVGEYSTPFGTPGAVAAQGNLLLVSDWDGLYSYDVSDPAEIVQQGIYLKPDVEPWINEIAISDGYAYLAYPNVGLSILDLNDPAALQEVSYIPGGVMGLEVYGDYVYTVNFIYSPQNYFYNSLSIIDITNPAIPQVLGAIDLPYDPNNSASDVVVSGAYAYVICSELGIYIIDVSDSQSPQIVQTFSPGGNLGGIMLRDEQLYLLDLSGGMRVLSIADPLNPQEISYTEWSESRLCLVEGMVMQTNQAIVLDQFAYLLTVDEGLLVYYLGRNIH